MGQRGNTERKQKKTGATGDGDSPQANTAAQLGLTEEEIRYRAYRIYEERGKRPGDPVADWLRAEQILREERKQNNVVVKGQAGGGRRARGERLRTGQRRA